MVINTNIPSAYASRVLSTSTTNLAKSLAKLSSGSRLVSPDEDAAGLAQSMKFSAEIGRIGAAKTNVGNAMSYSQTQDGFLSKIDTALRRMSELATLAADNTKSNDDVANYNKEFAELKAFIKSSAGKQFNGVDMFTPDLADIAVTGGTATIKTTHTALTAELATFKGAVAGTTALDVDLVAMALELKQHDTDNGTDATITNLATAKAFLEGANYLNKTYATAAATDAGIQAYIDLAQDTLNLISSRFGGIDVTDASDASSYSLKGVDLTTIKDDMEIATGNMQTLTKSNAAAFVTTISTHINSLAGHRANVGANISRLNMVESQLAVYGENLAAANSRIADVDVASESANYAKQQILVQSGTAMLAQANLLSQSALRLLQ